MNNTKKTSVLAVIPARGGSKGLPGKNIKMLNGKPLIAYTIEAAIQSGVFERVVVSTDSREIADISMQYGAEVPFIRPEHLSGDEISSDDVILHALDFYSMNGKKFDVVCKLQPTSPLRTEKHIVEAYGLMNDKNSNYVVSVCECEHSPLWSGIIGENLSLENFIKEENKRACRQIFEKYYRLNGAIYFGKVESFQREKNFMGQGSIAYIMKQKDSIDIDTELDFLFAETVLRLPDNWKL